MTGSNSWTQFVVVVVVLLDDGVIILLSNGFLLIYFGPVSVALAVLLRI